MTPADTLATIQPEDLFGLKFLQGAQLSPDGQGLHAPVLGRVHRQVAPAAADVQQPFAGAEPEFAADVLQLALLGGFEVFGPRVEVGARVLRGARPVRSSRPDRSQTGLKEPRQNGGMGRAGSPLENFAAISGSYSPSFTSAWRAPVKAAR